MEQEIERVTAEYTASDLYAQPKTVYRINTKNGRLYYTMEGGQPQYYLSVTTVIRRTQPTSEFLVNWKADMGVEEAEAYTLERANYGTTWHIMLKELLVERTFDLDATEAIAQAIAIQEGFEFRPAWTESLKKDILAAAAFIQENNVTPLAIEMVLTSVNGYAGAVDLICEMDIKEKGFFGEVYKTGDKKGQPKESSRARRVIAIVDFKSGRNFYKDHEIQLSMYRELVRENFPELNVEKLFNVSPKDWRTAPTYNMKDQTDTLEGQKVPHILKLAKLDEMGVDRTITKIGGRLDLSKGVEGIMSTIQCTDLSTIVIERMAEMEAAIQV